MASAKKPFPLPTGYFGIPLGLGALSLAWSHAADVYPQLAACGSAPQRAYCRWAAGRCLR